MRARLLDRHSLLRLGAVLALIFVQACSDNEPPDQQQLQSVLEAFLTSHEAVPGLSVVVMASDTTGEIAASVGVASPDGALLTADTPVRLASITKTYVAATFLKLSEQGRADLDAPITGLVAPEYDVLLSGDGYDTSTITPRHLLMHTSGMPDHARDEYTAIVFENPARQWTRQDQVALGVEIHDPLGAPNTVFEYSDTGYVLLGHIIERLTGERLADVVRQEMRFDELGLSSTWWEQSEEPPSSAPARAHQYLGGVDTYDWNGSLDMYGGGGLISSMRDMAAFMSALMQGEIFEQPETLDMMVSAPGHPFPEEYRIGLFPIDHEGHFLVEHGGFWGTHVLYAPELQIVVAGVVLEQSGYRDLRDQMREFAVEFSGKD